jgi:hypothetical protein
MATQGDWSAMANETVAASTNLRSTIVLKVSTPNVTAIQHQLVIGRRGLSFQNQLVTSQLSKS